MMTLDLELARRNMVLQQVRPWDVLDQRVLDLIAHAPREDYVPAALRNLAYVDMNLPLGGGQVMLAPKYEARLLQELEIKPSDKILEIGTGTGYLTSLLASLGQHVYSVDIDPEFTRAAGAKLAAHGIRNVTLESGDAARGWDRHAPYDVIIVTGSLPSIPQPFRDQLAPGGRLAAIVGDSPAMEAMIVRRLDTQNFSATTVFETDLPRLANAHEPAKFVF
jgi:protein-L-isoaspartate(D-aspartate) O-methyltransferase